VGQPVTIRGSGEVLNVCTRVDDSHAGVDVVRYERSPVIATTRICRSTTTTPNVPPRAKAIGRYNWTFFGSDRGSMTAAVLRSFVASCELVKIDPFAWFHDVLSRVADYPMTRLDELLPHRWSQANA
jgi:hypothetical protein